MTLDKNDSSSNTISLYCSRCGKKLPEHHKKIKRDDGNYEGKCLSKGKGGCQRNTIFYNEEQMKAIKSDKPIDEILALANPNKVIHKKVIEQAKKIQRNLKNPKLLLHIIDDVQNGEGVTGEEDTIIAITIVANTRLVKNASAESKNLLISDETGIGKDYTTDKILKVVVPENKRFHVTKMTKEAFTYWHANEETWDWNDKVIHIEDIPYSILNSSTFKVMASGGSHAVVVKDQKTIEIPINGKPVIIPTSHHTNLNDENLRRFPCIRLDESTNQTRKIIKEVSTRWTGKKEREPNVLLRKAMEILKPYEVVIPFAEIIDEFFPDYIHMRTHYNRFLAYVASSTALHQYQRDKDEKGRLIATPDDYMLGRLTLMKTTSNPRMVPLSKEWEQIINILKNSPTPLTIREIANHSNCPRSIDWLYKNIKKIQSATNLIEVNSEWSDGANKKVNLYSYVSGLDSGAIPTWNNIVKNLKKQTDGNNLVLLNEIQPFYGEVTPVLLVLLSNLCMRQKTFKKYCEEESYMGDVDNTNKTINTNNTTLSNMEKNRFYFDGIKPNNTKKITIPEIPENAVSRNISKMMDEPVDSEDIIGV